MTHVDCSALACGLVEYYGHTVTEAWLATPCEWRALVLYRFEANRMRKTRVRPMSSSELDKMMEIDEARQKGAAHV